MPPAGVVFNDFCATTGPNPVAVSRNYITSGDRVPATVVTEAPVGARFTEADVGVRSSQGLPGAINGGNADASAFPPTQPVPTGAGSVGFEVATSYVPLTSFLDVHGAWADAGNGIITTNGRVGRAWVAMVPPDPPPALPIPTLAVFLISGTNPVVGGQRSLATVASIGYSGISSGGGPTITLTSSHPAIASVPATVVMPPAPELGQEVPITTFPPAVDTPVTITATDGRYTLSAILTVLAPPPPPLLSAVSVNPASVVGGNPATGTITLSAPAPTGGAVVFLSAPATGIAMVPASVTVPAGATSATFTIPTTAVCGTFTVIIGATLSGTTRVGQFLVTGATVLTVSSVSLNPTNVVGSSPSTGTVTLTAAPPPNGAVVTLASNSIAATVPASVIVAAATSANFTITTSAVASATVVTITASFGGVSCTAGLTVSVPPPIPSVPSLLSPADQATVAQPITFAWTDAAAAASYEIQIDDANPFTTPLTLSQTVTVARATITGLPAQRLFWRVRGINFAGVAGPFSAARRFTAAAAPAAASLSAVSVNPASVVGGNGVSGTVTLTSAAPSGGFLVNLSSSNVAVATVPASVAVAAGATSASFTVTTSSVAISTAVTITGTGGGVTRTATLTVNPVPPPASLSAITLSPSTVTGGGSATGTATLTSAAPSGGLLVTLASSNAAIATVPASVTVAAGATSASFMVTTGAVTSSTAVTITGTGGGATRTAILTVNPQPAGALLTLAATGRAGESISSSPAGLTVNVGTTGSASFTTGTSVTLSVSNGRSAIWSGGCSSGGAKVKSCTFTINSATSVTANVQ